jgi:DNA-directed RNA polymerase specialized sigma24 family protein
MRRRDSSAEPPDNPPPSSAAIEHPADLALARAVLSGSRAAWEAFVERYSGLVLAMARRHARDEDEVRGLYADVLERVYRRRLSGYQGRAALSTWLVVVTRSIAMDRLRRRIGRWRMPDAVRALEPDERQIFRLRFMDGRPVEDVLAHARNLDPSWNAERLHGVLARMEAGLDRASRRRAAYAAQARATGAGQGRLLEYLDHLREEERARTGSNGPELEALERESRRMLERIEALVAQLGDDERRLMHLYFDQGLPAPHIADTLGFPGPRRVHTILERIVRQLRRRLEQEGVVEP